MSVFDRLGIAFAFFGTGLPQRAAAQDVAKRWQAAFHRDPRLAEDLIRMGGLLAVQPVTMTDGAPDPAPLDPTRLAYEAGRRDLALSILSAGKMTITELNQLMESLNE